MKSVVDDSRMIGTLIGGHHSMFLENAGHKQKIEPLPIVLKPSEAVPAGTKFTHIGSNETGAGNHPVHVNEGFYLEYQGIIRSLDGNLAIFYQRPGDDPDRYLPCYWYFADQDGGYFIYFTPSNSGRLLKLTHCKFLLL